MVTESVRTAAGVAGILTQAGAGGDAASLPDWIEAVGTAGAFLLAAIGALVTIGDRRRAVATRIYGSFVADGAGDTVVRVENRADLPIYDCRAVPVIAGTHHAVQQIGTVPPGGAVTGGTSLPLPVAGQRMGTNFLGVELSFRDNAGFTWKRSAGGRLRRVRRGRNRT